MDAINIPPEYWTIAPRGFAAAAAPFRAAIDALIGDAASAAGPLVNGDNAELVSDLATVDGENDFITAARATEQTALVTTPTGDVVSRYGSGDAKTGTANAGVDALERNAVQVGVAVPRPPVSIGDTPLPGDEPDPDRKRPPGAPASAPSPGADVSAGHLNSYDDVTGAYWQFLGRAASKDEYLAYWADVPNFREGIANSPEAQAYAASGGAAGAPGGSGGGDGNTGGGARPRSVETAVAPVVAEAPDAPPPPNYVTAEQLAEALSNIEVQVNLWV